MSVVPDPPCRYRPCLLLAHRDPSSRTDLARRFRRLGWDVYLALTGPELRRLARMLDPELVVLDVHLDGESGWLTCAKLTSERPTGRVVLLADESDHGRERAAFVGAAAVVPSPGGLTALLQAASWFPPLAAAG